MSRRRHTTDSPPVNQSAKFGIPQIDDLAVRCAAGAIAVLGPETVLEVLVMTDEQVGQLLKKAVSSLSQEGNTLTAIHLQGTDFQLRHGSPH